MKFRVIPSIVDAIQWTGSDASFKAIGRLNQSAVYRTSQGLLIITTKDGDERADEGDWVVRGPRGDLYPVREDIFKQTYEKIN